MMEMYMEAPVRGGGLRLLIATGTYDEAATCARPTDIHRTRFKAALSQVRS